MKTSCDHCGSSDAREVYEDHSYCYKQGCPKPWQSTKERPEMNASPTYTPTTMGDIPTYGSYPINSRGITQEVVDFFNVKMSVDSDRNPESHYYPYTKGGQTVAYKERRLPKQFCTHGDFKDTDLFGQSLFSGGRTLVITEGEIDCLSVAQAFKGLQRCHLPCCIVNLPLVALLLSSGLVIGVNSFDKVILMLDQDEAGQSALAVLAKMIKPGKARVAQLPEKDANETLMKQR